MAEGHEHDHGPGGGQMEQMLQVFQQKIGNMELTMNALIGLLIDEGVVDQDELNEKAQEIVEQIQEQQAAAPAEDIAEELED